MLTNIEEIKGDHIRALIGAGTLHNEPMVSVDVERAIKVLGERARVERVLLDLSIKEAAELGAALMKIAAQAELTSAMLKSERSRRYSPIKERRTVPGTVLSLIADAGKNRLRGNAA